MFSDFRPFHTRRLFFRGSPTNVLKVVWNSQGVAKNMEKQGFFCGCLVSVFFFFISSPHGHLSSSHTLLFANVSFILAFLLLLLCFPSLRWLCFLVSFYSFLSLLCSLLFIQLFVFAVFSLGARKTQIERENISQFCFHACASVPASPHFHLAQLIILLSPEKNPSKWFIFALFLAL